jgi:hypothetical protein
MGLTITTGVLAAIVLAITGALLLSPFNLLGATALEGAVAAGVEGEVIAGAPAAAAAAGEAGVAAPAAAAAAGEAGVAAPAVGTIKLRRRHHQETLGTDKFSAVEYSSLPHNQTIDDKTSLLLYSCPLNSHHLCQLFFVYLLT